MFGFRRDAQGNALFAGTSITDLLAEAAVGTPAYLYDIGAIEEQASSIVRALADSRHLVAYAVKANSAGTILRTLSAAGLGADVVSGAELELALACGFAPSKVVMSGVAKTDQEIDLAIRTGIRAIQVESVEEITRVAARATAAGRRAAIAFRINPGVEIDSHSHVATGHDAAKFGIARRDLDRAWATADGASEALEVIGVSAHVGSMLSTPEPYVASARAVCEVVKARLASGHSLRYIDFGGGFGIDYGGKPVQPPAEFARAALGLLQEQGLADLDLVLEPGRSLVGAFGVLVARVVSSKVSGERRWLMIDAGMNDLIRPALYGAHHRIEALDNEPSGKSWRVVGPVCESSDDFGEHQIGDNVPSHVVVRDAGAYGFVMASEYNGRVLPAEVFVRSGRVEHVSQSPGRSAWIERRLRA